MENVRNDINFNVNSETKYYLTIIIGNGQIGNSTFKDVKGRYHTGTIVNTYIGKGTELKDSSILIGSIVTDVNPRTNRTIITYKINEDDSNNFQKDVDDDNGSIYYTTKIRFI